MAKPYITTKFDEDVTDYDKQTGDSKGENSINDVAFKDNVLSYLKSVKDGSFLAGGLKKLNLSLKALLEKGLGLLSLDKAKSNLLEKLKDSPFSLKSAGMGGLLKLLTVSEKIFGNLVEQISDSITSKIIIPDPVYLASLIGFDIAGADLEVNDNYIRKLILKRDITIALKWWNKTWEIEYTGLRSDKYTIDAVIAAQHGCYKNVEYILGEFKKSHSTLVNSLTTIPVVVKSNNMNKTDTDNYNRRIRITQYAEEVFSMMAYVIKELIVSSYSNFSADELKNILDKTGIQPSVFGLTDERFGGRYAIKSSDINQCAPFFKMDTFSDIEKFSNIRSSRYRREYIKKNGKPPPASRSSTIFQYINPRNRNIKRLYLVLVSNSYESKMYNPDFAKRLQYKIANVFIKSLEGIDLIPSGLFKTQEELWYSAYDYTKSIEEYLFDPSKVSDLKLADTTIITMPKQIESAVVIDNKYSDVSKQTNYINKQYLDRRNIIIDTIGPTLVIDNIKNDINNYNNQPFIESPIYDNLGNRIIRNGQGGYILANDNGDPILDEDDNTIPIDSSNVSLIPRETRNPKSVIPTDLDSYIKRLVDQYTSLNIRDVMTGFLNNIKTNNISVSTTDSFERLAFKHYIESGGLFHNEINVDQVLVIIINNIQNGTISAETLKEKPISQLMNETVAELKTNNNYTPVFNGESTINKVKLSISLVQNNINKINSGEILPGNISTYSEVTDKATIMDNKGIISYLGSIDTTNSPTTDDEYVTVSNNGKFTDAIILAVQDLNDRLLDAYKQNKSSLSYTDLMGNTESFDKLVSNYENKTKPIEVSELRKILKETIIDLLKNILNDIVSTNNIPEFVDLYKTCIDKSDEKYNLSQVLDVLKDLGMDVAGYDVMSYYRELDKKLNENKDESFYDFDVINPPVEVLKSLDEEYSKRMNFKYRYYVWLNELEI